jgi:endonuclease YncB( thermonuclease family)
MDLVADKAYSDLLTKVQGQILAGRERVRKLVEEETVRLYWEVGGSIGTFLESADNTYGRRVIRRLADDTDLHPNFLYDAVKFHTLFPIFPTSGILTWSHYRLVLTVYSEGGRDFYLEQATQHEWTVRELSRQIQDEAFERYLGIPMDDKSIAVLQNPPRLQAKRGEPYIYRVAEKWSRQVLDLGFRASHPLPDSQTHETGAIVRSVPDGRVTSGYRVESADLRARIYAYRATVSRIIDGDTLWATVDLGFNHWTDVKLRLRGIDAPEVGTAGGKRATDYLTQALSEANAFVVTTTKVDLYDRYLADLFVLPDQTDLAAVASKGRYINRAMINDGVARLWTDTKPPEF